MLIGVLENARGRNRCFMPSSLDWNYRFCIFMQKYQRFCIFIHFCYFTSFNITFVNILTIASKSASFPYTFQSWYLSYAKPWVSGPKTLGFAFWNPWFYNLKPRLSDRKSMGISNRSPCTPKLYIYAIVVARRYIGQNICLHSSWC